MKQGCANKENKQAQSSSDHTEDSHKWMDMPKPDKQRVKRLCQSLSLAQVCNTFVNCSNDGDVKAHGREAATLDDEMRFLLEFYEKTLAEV